MLYEKNKKDKKLDFELFKNPTSDYRATPFWAWNCDLDKDELLRQIDIFKEMGYGGYHMHVRSGLSTPYLSDEFMALIKACVEHGKEKEMISWLYDEDRWPSGFAGGLVTKNPEFRQHILELVTSKQQIKWHNPILLACYDVKLDEKGCLDSYKIIGENEEAEGTLRMAYMTRRVPTPRMNNQGYVDTLNKKAIEKFIEVTHEVYARELQDEFGKSIPSIFTDEPQFAKKARFPLPTARMRSRSPGLPTLKTPTRRPTASRL